MGVFLRLFPLGSFIGKNKNENIELKNGTSNTINFSNIQEIFKILLLDFKSMIKKINIDLNDYSFILDKDFGDKYILEGENKIKFFKIFIDRFTNFRHLIVHGKSIDMGDKEEIYKLFLIIKKYLFNDIISIIIINLKNNIRNNKIYK